MAITANLLTEGSASPGTGVSSTTVTASITPGANRLIMLTIAHGETPATTVPTATGCNLTWVLVDSQQQSTSNQRVTILRAMGASPTTGAVTISWGGTTRQNVAWKIIEFDGVDTGGTNGSAAVPQSAKSAGGGGTATADLTNAPAAGSATLGVATMNSTTPAWSVQSGFTQIGNSPALSSPSNESIVFWSSTGTDPIVVANNGSPGHAIVGVEIKAPSGASFTGSAAISGTGTISASGQRTAIGSAAISATSSITARMTGWSRTVAPDPAWTDTTVSPPSGWIITSVLPPSGWL